VVTTTEPLLVAAEVQQAAAVAEPQQPATEVEPQPAASMTVVATAVAVTTPPNSPMCAVAGSPRVAVVEIPDDDDIPPPSWDQWASAPVPAPEASEGALVARGGVGATLGRPVDGAGASSSRVGPAVRLEQGREDADALPAHFIKAQVEQGLWQELRDHGASLNRALNEALRIHSGPAWRVFQVGWVSWGFEIPSLAFSVFVFLLTLALLASLVGGRSWSAGLASDTTPSTSSTLTFNGSGGSTRSWTPSSRP
jgi:hypothetical protein